MEELKDIIANNIIKYRKELGLTQLELAEKLNYSDKSVSKWERAEGIPDAVTLKQLADLFGVTVDALMSKEQPKKFSLSRIKETILTRTNIVICSVILAWLVATICFVLLRLFSPETKKIWLAFIYALPVSFIILTVFNCLWGKTIFHIIFVSGIIWSIALSLFLSVSYSEMWLVFLICIPLELLVIIFFPTRHRKQNNKK